MDNPQVALVTGATGFIGSHLVERLAAMGMEVRCVVRRSSSLRFLPLAAVRILEADLATGDGLREACRGADVVFHVAGVTKAPGRAGYYAGNVAATETLLRACADVPRLVHVSSLAAVGPSPDGVPVTEETEPHPVSTYGRTKLLAESAVRASVVGPRAVIMRPPVVYGPRDTDVLHFLRAVSRGWLPRIGKAESFFSAIFVKDLADGLIAAARRPGASGRTYFIAGPEPCSWAAFGAAAAALMGHQTREVAIPRALAWTAGLCAEAWGRLRGKPSIISREKMREACYRYWTCDPSRAAEELGFAPPTGLREGLAETVAWYREAGWLK